MGLNKFVSFFGNNSDSNNNRSDRITKTYSSELDIYGNSQRLKKSLLWSSLRKPKRDKDHNRLVGSGTPTTTTILHTTPRKIETSPRITISPKATKRVSIQNNSSTSTNTTHHPNDIVQSDRIFNSKAHTNANQVDRIVNNGKIDNCLNGIGSARSVITATKATSTIDVVDANLVRANKGVVALGVLVKYLVDDLDAFNTPHLKKSNAEQVKLLMESRVQLAEKDEYFKNRENEIKTHYKGELSQLEDRYRALDDTTKAHITSLEQQLFSQETEHGDKIQNVTNHFQATIAEKDAELVRAKHREEELLQQIKALSSTENELREKVQASETEFSERLQLAALREREITDKFTTVNKDLSEQLTSANNEILVLRSSLLSKEHAASKGTNGQRPMTLENEIQSWRSVLEMKQKEFADLQRRNHELENSAAALPGALTKISVLESRLEDVTIQLKNKTDEEQELLQKNRQLEQSYRQEMKNRSVVALDNEQLKYRLKTNTEKFSSALIELAKHNDSSMSDSSAMETFCVNDASSSSSPPTTPVVKGVVEKTASVAYLLQINDEETPEALASRIIRRAGSFRQNDRNRLVQLGNALTQSASATSVLRQISHSGTPRTNSTTIRTRSKSVSTNSNNASSHHEEKSTNNLLATPQWRTPICSSSPNSKRSANTSNDNELLLSEESETECSSVSRPNADKGHFRRSNSYKHTKRGLITCSTAALTSQRPDLCLSLPEHSTVNELKKFQQIKESAGEAMVSGTNSEDEASTASSDGSLSSRSSSSGGRRRSSLEDANIDKIVTSLGAGNDPPMGLVGTPMEGSWSEDVDHFASDSAV